MDSEPTGGIVRAFMALGGVIWSRVRGLRAQKAAAEQPNSYKSQERQAVEAALGRISHPRDDDTLFTRSYDGLARKYFTPAFLRSENVRQWLADEQVRKLLLDAASAKALGSAVSAQTTGVLEEKYQSDALASHQEASAVVAAVVAMLAVAIGENQAALTIASYQTSSRQFSESFEELRAHREGAPPSSPDVSLTEEVLELWRGSFSDASISLERWPTSLAGGRHIVRPELQQLLETINGGEKSVSALLGLPGSGKSALLSRLYSSLKSDSKLPVLAIKGDLLSPEVRTEEELRVELALPKSPSEMLRGFSEHGGAVLLVDQLDALAGHLDTKTGRLSVLLNLVKAAATTGNVHVVISCRTFEFEHDVRLSKVDATPVELSLPSWETVNSLLAETGLGALTLPYDIQETLRVPQHLKTFLLLRESGVEPIATNYTMMLDQLWRSRIEEVPDGGDAAVLAYSIADKMAEDEALWLASARFDTQRHQLNRLKAMGLLTESKNGSVAFSHQTVFEHVLARSFTRGKSLSEFVLARNASLFVRPKFWATLHYLRNAEPSTYSKELATIWRAPLLRPHLRYLLIEFMGAQTAPFEQEKVLIGEAVVEPTLLPLVLRAAMGSSGWFSYFAEGVLRSAMVNEATASLCVPVLAKAWEFAPGEVLKLLDEQWLGNPAQDSGVLLVLEDASIWNDDTVRVASIVLRRHRLPAWRADSFISAVGSAHPKVALALLRTILTLELDARTEEAQQLKEKAEAERPKDTEPDVAWLMDHDFLKPIEKLLDDDAWGHIPSLALESPQSYVEVMWSFYSDLFIAMAEIRPERVSHLTYPQFYRVDYRFEGETTHGLGPSPLLDAIVTATQSMVDSSAHEFLSWVESNIELELHSVHRLIAHGFACKPSVLASEALNYLLADPRRLFLSSPTDWMSTSVRLVSSSSLHWSEEQVLRFEDHVKRFSLTRPSELSSPDEIRRWPKLIRSARVRLLAALPEAARSEDVRQLLREAERAQQRPSAVPSFKAGWIGPPMSLEQFRKATDEDIVNAFREISDDSDWDHSRDFGRGGNSQLSHVLGTLAEEHPERAIRIVRMLEPQFAQRGAGYALASLAKVASADEVMDLLLELVESGYERVEFRTSVVQAVGRLVERQLRVRDEVIQLLDSWLVSAEGGRAENVECSVEGAATVESQTEFLLAGNLRYEFEPGGDYPLLNTLLGARLARGEAVEAIEMLRNYLEKSKSGALWACLADSLASLPKIEPVEGAELVGDVLKIEALDGTWHAAHLMAHTHFDALPQVLSALHRWRLSESFSARRGFGELVVLLAFTNPLATDAKIWLDEIVKSPDGFAEREGAASSLVKLFWKNQKYRQDATAYLIHLLGRDEPLVWHQVFALFGEIESLENDASTVRLLTAIAEHIEQAPAPLETYVVERLQGLLPSHADLVARISKRLVQLWRNQLTEVGSLMVTAGQEMMDVALTLHRISGVELDGLQIFEQLLEIDAYQAREVLNQIDRRVALNVSRSRPRLKRKGRRRRSFAVPTIPA